MTYLKMSYREDTQAGYDAGGIAHQNFGDGDVLGGMMVALQYSIPQNLVQDAPPQGVLGIWVCLGQLHEHWVCGAEKLGGFRLRGKLWEGQESRKDCILQKIPNAGIPKGLRRAFMHKDGHKLEAPLPHRDIMVRRKGEKGR